MEINFILSITLAFKGTAWIRAFHSFNVSAGEMFIFNSKASTHNVHCHVYFMQLE